MLTQALTSWIAVGAALLPLLTGCGQIIDETFDDYEASAPEQDPDAALAAYHTATWADATEVRFLGNRDGCPGTPQVTYDFAEGLSGWSAGSIDDRAGSPAAPSLQVLLNPHEHSEEALQLRLDRPRPISCISVRLRVASGSIRKPTVKYEWVAGEVAFALRGGPSCSRSPDLIRLEDQRADLLTGRSGQTLLTSTWYDVTLRSDQFRSTPGCDNSTPVSDLMLTLVEPFRDSDRYIVYHVDSLTIW
jgi:hypothetical protein